MSAKTIIFLCIQGLMAHAVFAQCYGNTYNPAYGLAPNGYNLASSGYNMANSGIGLAPGGIGLAPSAASLAPSNIVAVPALNSATINGGGFTVTSSSPIAPAGVSVVSEYVIEGPLTVGGQLPVLSSVAVDAQLPSSGTAATNYGCGNGNVAITSEAVSVAANAAAAASNIAAANSAAFAAERTLLRPSGCGY